MKNTKDVKVELVVRVTRVDGEARERAVLIAKKEDGNEYVFCYRDLQEELQDLIVCVLIKDVNI